MKNFTNNFKQFTSRLSARWLIMALMMLVGTSSAWAATQRYIYVGLSDNYHQLKTANEWGINQWGGTNGGVISGSSITDLNTTITYSNCTFHMYRMYIYDDNKNFEFKGNNNWWDCKKENASAISGTTKNAILFRDNDGGDGGSPTFYQTDYQETSTASLAVSATSVNTNTNVTLTPSLSTNATYNAIKSTSYSISPSTGASISGNTFKATAAGTYTVTATVTYNPKYFTDITKTATATKEIEVKQACTDPSNIKFTVTSPKNTYYLGDKVAATLSYDGTEVESGHSWTYDNTAIGISGPAPTKGASFTFTLKKVTNSTDIKINLPKCSSGTVASSALNFAITALPAPTGQSGTGSTTSATLNWTPNSTYKTVMVVRYAKGAAVTAPTQGTEYTAGSSNIGNGTVVYKGTGTSYTNTGLTTGNSYDYYFYTVNNNYYSTSVKATVSTCVTVVEPAVTMSPANGTVCQGSPVTLTLTTRQSGVVYKIGEEEIFKSTTTYSFVPKTNSVTVTAFHANACDGTNNKTKTFSISIKSLPEAPTFTSNSMTVCAGEPFTLPTPTNLKVGTEDCIWSVGGKTTTGSQPGISQTTVYTAVKNDGCPSPSVEFTVNVTPIPTISGATFTQPGQENAIELTVPTGNDTKWTVNKNGDLNVATGSSTMFSAENKDTYTITADYNGCTDTHDVTVDDAFYVYFRAPKEGEETTQSKDAWYQFYYPNENSEQYRGGAMYYGESDAMPTSATLQNFNKGGKTAEIIFTDCDDYTWYGFKASAEVIAGTKCFYVHATNDKGLNGCHTHTKPQKLPLTGDIYYTLGDNGICYDGWAVNKVSAPYAGPKVHASGSTALGTNQFAALYVTDCSGKEIDAYQWESCGEQAGTYANYKASVSNSCTLYSGDAGETNNIRPETLGWYRCKVTYKDGSTVTSKPVQVTGTYTHASSTLPVIIVNTNGVGFPVNNTCQTPSAHADDMKEKVSVDVKIYDGSTMVYDRKARMNYRGSSSLNFLKKSYAFCPGKDNCVEDKGRLDYVKTEKMNMLGIGTAKDKDWVLYAAAADPSLMRNRLMFDTFRDMTGGWSVNSRYVELYVDGEYKGVYVMMDKVTKNEGRVNITDPNGFIVKFDKTDLVDRYEADGDKKTFKSLYSGYDGESGNGMKTYDTYIDQRFEIEYPEMEDVEEDNPGMWAKTVNDIKTLFNNFESNLKAGNYAEVQKIIDYISWADWFIISEYAKNMDAYRASCLFVYDGGKIEARPLWDQELSFSNTCANLCGDYNCNSTEGLLIENSTIYTEGCAPPFWFTGKYVGGRGTEAGNDAEFDGSLLNDPCFIAVLKERWALHTATGGALTQDVMNAKISGYEKDLGSVGTSGTPLYRERNTYWSGKSRKTIDKANSGGTCFTGETGYQDTEISTSISAMKSWITGNRRTNLGTLITDMEGSPLSISFMPQEVTTTPWEPITLQVINTSSYDYTITYTDGELDKQSGVIINKTDDTFKINVPRPDKWGIGNEKVEGERADITYGIKATLNVADGTTVCGKSEVTPATATIILEDEPNEDCD